MNNFYSTKLSEIAEVFPGQSPNSESFLNKRETNSIPFLQGSNNFGNLYPQVRKFTSKITRLSKQGDVLISVRAPVGDINIANEDICIGRGLAAIRAFDGNNKFLYYALKYNIDNITKVGSGTKFSGIDKDVINEIQLIIPREKKDRIKVASLLFALDSKIEINNQINTELENISERLYNFFINSKFKKENSNNYKHIDELKLNIPSDWNYGKFGDYCPSYGGFAFKSSSWSNSGFPVVKIQNINENYSLDFEKITFIDSSTAGIDDKYVAKPGTVVIALTGATIGKYGITYDVEKPLMINQRVGIFETSSNPIYKLPFLINSLKQDYFRQKVYDISNGSDQDNISTDEINDIPLIIPSQKVLDNYNLLCRPFYEEILLNKSENFKLNNLKKVLLPMLMSDKIKIT